MNKATAHAMLSTLVDEGVLIRHPADMRYTLGPALIGLGSAAVLDSSAALDLATSEMVSISIDLDVSCVATALIGTDLVVLARHDVSRPLFNYHPVGHRSPLIPPQGREFFAWAPKARVLEWIDRIPGRVNKETRAQMFALLAETREQGYVVFADGIGDLHRWLTSLRDLPSAELQQRLNALISDLRHMSLASGSDLDALANSMISPVFGPDGNVLLGIVITGFPEGIGREDMRRFRNRLLTGTQRITELLHGCVPVPDWADEIPMSKI
jgi:DNA-binding IclR family transcriptional regulator